jgi:hypothetical protein
MQSQPEIERIVLHSRAVENRGKKKGGDAYDLGGAKQRTVIDEKEEKKTRREQRMEGEKSQSVDSVENHLDEEVGDPVFEGRAAGAPGLAN